MSDSICISVSDNRGTSHYRIKRFKKRYVVLLSTVLLSLLIGGGYSIYFLYQQTQLSDHQLNQLNVQAEQLSESLTAENTTNDDLTKQLADKNAELLRLTQRVDDVETILGLQGDSPEDITLDQRIDSAAISSAVRGTLFRLIPNGNPTDDVRLSSSFGTRIHPITGKRKSHRGLDFAANTGAAIYAPADAVIELVRPSNKGYGNHLKLSHSLGFTSSYSHMSKFNVKRGQFVRKGDLIGWTGNTGMSTGPHLHYEIRFLGRAINPRPFVDWTPDNFDNLFEKEKTVQWAALLEMVNNVVSMQVQLTYVPQPAEPIETATTQVVSSDERKL
jgi:murein DD-endopeptidase MepM/ murein hydrolase activator NlpD